MLENLVSEIIANSKKYARMLEEYKASWNKSFSSARIHSIWKELRQSIQDLNNRLK